MAVKERHVAVLGAGTIGEALISGLLSDGWRRPDEIIATGRREERVEELREALGVEATLSNADAVAGAALVVIAVKPQDFTVLLDEIATAVTPEQTVLSVAAAIPTASIEARLAEGVPVVRAMPNAPATVHEGIAGLCSGVLRTSFGGDDRSRNPPRSRARGLDPAGDSDDARNGEAPPRREHAPRRAPRASHVAGRH